MGARAAQADARGFAKHRASPATRTRVPAPESPASPLHKGWQHHAWFRVAFPPALLKSGRSLKSKRCPTHE
eukprot:15481287-Alexandrium_andersonii.AAC.1